MDAPHDCIKLAGRRCIGRLATKQGGRCELQECAWILAFGPRTMLTDICTQKTTEVRQLYISLRPRTISRRLASLSGTKPPHVLRTSEDSYLSTVRLSKVIMLSRPRSNAGFRCCCRRVRTYGEATSRQ